MVGECEKVGGGLKGGVEDAGCWGGVEVVVEVWFKVEVEGKGGVGVGVVLIMLDLGCWCFGGELDLKWCGCIGWSLGLLVDCEVRYGW